MSAILTSPRRLDIEDRRRLYLLGTEKQGAAIGPEALQDLALLAMRGRFDRPPAPGGTPRNPLPADPRPLISDEARTPLLRLCSGKTSIRDDLLGVGAVLAMHRSAVQLHPFDFARLEDFVVLFAGPLGARAVAWVRLVRPDAKEPQSAGETEAATEETLAAAGASAKLAFLRALRAGDRDRARVLIEPIFAEQSVAMRADLVDLLRRGLAADDIPFLERAAADRAKTVREKAAALLERIPGTSGYQAKLERLTDRVKVKTGVLGRRKKLSVLAIEGQLGLLAELFDGLRLEDVARALSLELGEFAELAAETPDIDTLVLRSAAAEGRVDLIPLFEAALIQNQGMVMAELLDRTLPMIPAEARQELLRACVRPRSWATLPDRWAFDRIYVALEEPLPLDVAAELLAEIAWSEALRKAGEKNTPALVDTFEAVAPLIPRQLSEKFIGEIGALAPRAALFHRFLLALPDPA
jgi:hypothetical protein